MTAYLSEIATCDTAQADTKSNVCKPPLKQLSQERGIMTRVDRHNEIYIEI